MQKKNNSEDKNQNMLTKHWTDNMSKVLRFHNTLVTLAKCMMTMLGTLHLTQVTVMINEMNMGINTIILSYHLWHP